MSADKDPRTSGKKKAAVEKAEDSPNGHKDETSTGHVVDKARAEAMRANMSAIATADVGSLQATGSALGVTSVGGDVEIASSAAGLVSAKGGADIHQAVTGAVISSGSVSVRQGGSYLAVAREYSVETGGAMTVVAAEAQAKHAFIGFLLAPKATLSDDSKVIIDVVGAAIIAGAIILGFGILALAGVRTARNVLAWRPKLPGLHWT